MSGAIVVKNLKEVLAAIDATEDKLERAAQQGIAQAGLAIQRKAQANANTGTHPRGMGHLPGTGPGPNVVTGALRRSIRTSVIRGFGDLYVATVGPTVEYARAVELGHPRWKSGVKYPYLEPAALELIRNGTVRRVFIGAVKAGLRG
jgi:hypothetical protein